MQTFTETVAKKESVTYPVRFEKALYEAMSEHCEKDLVETPIARYLRILVIKDLTAKGKWPVKG